MNIQDIFIIGLILLNLGLCVWVLFLDSRVYDLQRYIKRIGRKL